MVRIRLRRVGARNQPSFRIVASDKRSPRDGRFLEILGHYNPRTEPATVQVDEVRLFHWLQNGAQASSAVRSALAGIGTWERWEEFKAGAEMETLVEEAKAAIPDIDPRTRRADFTRNRPSKKQRAQEAAEAEAPAEAAAVPEAEDVAEPEAEASVEVAEEPEAEATEAAEAQAEPAPEPEAEKKESEVEAEAEVSEPQAEAEAVVEVAEPEAGEVAPASAELGAEPVSEADPSADDETGATEEES